MYGEEFQLNEMRSLVVAALATFVDIYLDANDMKHTNWNVMYWLNWVVPWPNSWSVSSFGVRVSIKFLFNRCWISCAFFMIYQSYKHLDQMNCYELTLTWLVVYLLSQKTNHQTNILQMYERVYKNDSKTKQKTTERRKMPHRLFNIGTMVTLITCFKNEYMIKNW